MPVHRASFARIYAVTSRIPRGRVATYGQIARLASLPGHARQVGYAMAALEDQSRVPWHRVVNAKGQISPRSGGSDMGVVQRLRLEREGVRFDAGGTIALARFRWRPRSVRGLVLTIVWPPESMRKPGLSRGADAARGGSATWPS